jgi:2-methylaconitate cis-trans-isomerase PrpF
MDQHYNWTDTAFKNRSWESINLATNAIADTLSTLYDATTTKTSTLKITVQDENNTPIQGATITSTSTPTGQTQIQGTTTTDGTATFTNIKPGTYTLNATKTGYKKTSTTTNVADGQDTQTIKMTKINNGIPGFPVEAIALGFALFLGYSFLFRIKRNKQNDFN